MPAASAPPAAAAPVPQQAPALFRGSLKPLYPLYRSFELWADADGLRMSAAMSFYGMLSLAPLLVLIVAGLGWWLDRELLTSSLVAQIGGMMGQQGAELVRSAIASSQEAGQGVFASMLAFVLLLVGATGVFAELQSAFERLWTQGTGVAAVDAWWHTATLRLRGVAYILAFGFLMLVSTVIASLLSLLEHWVSSRWDIAVVLVALNQLVSFLITTGLFVALMRMSAGPQPRLRYLLWGAAVGALLFGVGKHALALYLSTAAVVSAYGAAGSLVVLLMWIYFASAVLLFGASVARAMAERQGEFAPEATPPPAAAVTAAQAEVRKAGAPEAAQDTATVAAVLSDVASAAPVQAGAESPGERLAAARERPQPEGDAWRKQAAREGLALLISVAAAYWLSRPDQQPATRQEPRQRPRELEPPPAPAPQPRQTEGGSGSTWLGIAAALARGVQEGARLVGGSARRVQREADGADLRSPRAIGDWGGRAAELGASQLGTQWRQWRERRALAHARRMVARDVEALRDAVRRRF